MSTYAEIYSVNAAELRSAFGCKNVKLLSDILDKNREYIDAIDEGDAEDDWTCEKAINALIFGTLPEGNSDPAGKFGYAYEVLCQSFGRRLHNLAPISGDFGQYISKLDTRLIEIGVNICVKDLCFRGPLIALGPLRPRSFGYLTSVEVIAAIQSRDSLLKADGFQQRNDLLQWLEASRAIPCNFLVGAVN